MKSSILKTSVLFSLLVAMGCSSSSTENNTGNEEVAEETMEEVSDENAGVSFENLKDGDTLNSPFLASFEVEGMEIEPAGMVNEGKGHHHVVINDGDFVPEGEVIIADDTHIHYGKGQESDSLNLIPGNYQLTLQFADGTHISYGEKWSSTINIVVQ